MVPVFPSTPLSIPPVSAVRPGPRTARLWRGAALSLLAACALTACQRVTPPAPQMTGAPAAPDAAVSAPAAVPVAYTPPPAEALYQMVAPIALYPDKLVAQVLAGATYPDQVTAAEGWLGQNPGLKGDALAGAVESQPWDPSVKSLTAFPNVLEQMASNLPWTTALGKAYYHDPADVMNAIQALRARAAHAGTLKSSPRLRVATVEGRSAAPPPPPAGMPVAVYQGPAVVAPPPTVITIEPTEVQTVYVPRYDPAVVYGTPVAVYPSYRWAAPAAPVAVSAGPDPLAVGALAFGAGVVVAALASHHHHDWGWNAWDVHWGAPPPPPPPVAWGPAPPPPAWRPAVLYRGTTYVSNSPTVIENIHNRITVNNRNVIVAAPAQPPAGPGGQAPAAVPMALPGGIGPMHAALAPPQGAAPVRPGMPAPMAGRPDIPGPGAAGRSPMPAPAAAMAALHGPGGSAPGAGGRALALPAPTPAAHPTAAPALAVRGPAPDHPMPAGFQAAIHAPAERAATGNAADARNAGAPAAAAVAALGGTPQKAAHAPSPGPQGPQGLQFPARFGGSAGEGPGMRAPAMPVPPPHRAPAAVEAPTARPVQAPAPALQPQPVRMAAHAPPAPVAVTHAPAREAPREAPMATAVHAAPRPAPRPEVREQAPHPQPQHPQHGGENNRHRPHGEGGG